MIASVYIKDGNIHLYNEGDSLASTGGLAYELGKPLLNFLCYEQERFDEGFGLIAETFNNEYAHMGAREPEFRVELAQMMGELQQQEQYLFFYSQMLMDFIYAFLDSPQKAVVRLSEIIPNASEKLSWAMDFKWPTPPLGKVFYDKEKRLFRAAQDVVALMSEDFRKKQDAMIREVDLLIDLRETVDVSADSPLEYLYQLEEHSDSYSYLEHSFHTFYGALPTRKIVQLYEIHSIDDLFRFEFIKMIEHDIFIKKCKNCERFFIPKRRANAEYCERLWGEGPRKCSEIGATLRYEKKVAENPILDAHKKAYRRFNSRTRAKKMTQSEFEAWSKQAAEMRDACLAGELPFEEFVAWLEQGRVRKSRSKSS